MSSTLRLRNIFKTVVVRRIFNAWSRSYLVSSVVRRCRRDRSVREMLQCFRHVFFRPKQTLFLTVAAASKKREGGPPKSCNKNITDAELQALVNELDSVEVLAQKTLYCTGCMKRITLDKKQTGVVYCACKNSEPPAESYEGWVPYMEAEDVIIWRKEYKPGKGLYAYKVYGRYKDIQARDFAAIQVDGGYRRVWDTAVAALSIVERDANGVRDQAVLHWEVLWPRLFANRDYVYIRRHKEFDLDTKCLKYREAIFNPDHPCGQKQDHNPSHDSSHGHTSSQYTHHPPSSNAHSSTINAMSPNNAHSSSSNTYYPSNKPKPTAPPYYADNPLIERINVHSKAKRKSLELERMEREAKDKETPKKEVAKEEPKKDVKDEPKTEAIKKEEVEKNGVEDSLTKNKVYVIISKSCTHSQVPVTNNAIRVTEYWSRMVIKTIEGPDKPGTEFVLTYYDEPAVGGMPPVLASFATARGAPAFLARMRKAAVEYRAWLQMNPLKSDAPDFMPFGPEKVSFEDQQAIVSISEEEMESSKHGPDLSNEYKNQDTRDQSTQTDAEHNHPQEVKVKIEVKVEQAQSNQQSIEMCDIPEYAEKACQIQTEILPPGAIQEVKQSKTEDGTKSPERIANVVPERDSEANDKDDDALEEDSEKPEEEEKKSGWYRYLYPFYYFV